MKTALALGLLFLLSIGAYSQNLQPEKEVSKNFFSGRTFGKYFISDYYAPITKVNVGLGLNLKEYNISTKRNSDYILYNETSLGSEVPIFNKTVRSGSNFSKLSLSIPISMNIWFDFTEKETAPILNTDCRVALLEINYQKTTEWGFIENIGFKFIPFFHESTHIGDELMLFRLADSIPITRVNVSYEAAEFAVILNDDNGVHKNNHSIKIGARFLLNKNKGWYSKKRSTGDASKVAPSSRWVEWHAQYQHQRVHGLLATEKSISIISVELRNRVQFGYPFYSEDKNTTGELIEYANKERIIPSFNGLIGWKFRSDTDKSAKFGTYLRVYMGANPHGQFRNIPRYRFFGLSLIYEY